MVLYEVPSPGGEALHEGRYDCPTQAGLPRFHGSPTDKEMEFWREDMGRGIKPSGSGSDR